MGAGANGRVSNRALDILKFIEDTGGCTIKNSIVHVESACDEGMDVGFSI